MVQKILLGCGIVHGTLVAVVKAVRLRFAVPFVLLLVAIYVTALHPWMMNWGSIAAERQMTLPGDELIPSGAEKTTQAITIDAPADLVWQWLVQIGQDRAGFYSYTWLENLIGADIHNADGIHPEWQHLAVGDAWRLAPPDYLWGIGKAATTPVLLSQPGHALVLAMWGAFVIEPIDAHTSRLIVRAQAGPPSVVSTMVTDPIIFTMMKRMLLGLKARAEGQPEEPAVLLAIAQCGWAAAGIVVAGLFLSQRRRGPWLALPVVAALPALLMASDIQAGLAAFLAVGIVTLGFLAFGRDWWGSFLVIGSVVLLTLLLVPDAFVAICLALVVLFMATAGTIVAVRPSTLVGGPGPVARPAR